MGGEGSDTYDLTFESPELSRDDLEEVLEHILCLVSLSYKAKLALSSVQSQGG